MCRCRHANVLFSSLQHHLQPLLPYFLYILRRSAGLCLIDCPELRKIQECGPFSTARRPCRTYYLYYDRFVRQLAPIPKIPIAENSYYHNADEFITNSCLIIENSEKVALQTCNDLICG